MTILHCFRFASGGVRRGTGMRRRTRRLGGLHSSSTLANRCHVTASDSRRTGCSRHRWTRSQRVNSCARCGISWATRRRQSELAWHAAGIYVFFFFFFSASFSHHLGSPEWLWTSFFHFVMSSTSSSFNPTLSLLHKSFFLISVFPSVSFLFIVNILLSTCPLPLLLKCLYHFSLFSVIFFVTGAGINISQTVLYCTTC